MSPPKHELVVKDCDEALKLEPMYAKALNRRAFALEKLERYEESLRGMHFYPLFLFLPHLTPLQTLRPYPSWSSSKTKLLPGR